MSLPTMPQANNTLALQLFPTAAPEPEAQIDVFSPVMAQMVEQLDRVDTQIARLSEALTVGDGREDAMLAMIAQAAEFQSAADSRLADVLGTVVAALERLPAPAAPAQAPHPQPAYFAMSSAPPVAGARPNTAPEAVRPAPRYTVDYAALHEAAARNSPAPSGASTES